MEQPESRNPDQKVVVIGAGPAGLTAAYELTKYNIRPLVYEKLDKVGGIARTEYCDGFYFDMGGHRFFTKSTEVNRMWHEILDDDFLLRPRLSRIYYDRKFFDYPLKPFNALRGLGIWQSTLVGLSYLRWQIFPSPREDTFEQWVTNRFGKRLFNLFFKSYTEKVWGIPTSELSSEWAAQRIKGLSLKTAVLNMFIQPRETITTLIEEFHYPRRGPGMLWDEVKSRIELQDGEVHLNSDVKGIKWDGNRLKSVIVMRNGEEQIVEGHDFISSMPIKEFIARLDPPPPQAVLEAASQLFHRDFLTVCLMVDAEHLFDDNWIYVHDPDVIVGRIQNFKNWSPDMVPDPSMTSLGLEYFCNKGDELWSTTDGELIELGKREIDHVGLARSEDVVGGCVFRVEHTYPVYDSNYSQHLGIIRGFLENLENFQTIGRNGLHRYNNQDHAMLTGMLAVRNLVFGENNDLWSVNAEQEYLEEAIEGEVPYASEVIDETFARAFMKIDSVAFGISVGTVSGLMLFFVTLYVSLNQIEELFGYLYLLNEYFPGYDVNPVGSLLGLLYGFVFGFVIGWGIVSLRNLVVRIYISIIRRRAELKLLEKYGFFPDEQSSRSGDSDQQ